MKTTRAMSSMQQALNFTPSSITLKTLAIALANIEQAGPASRRMPTHCDGKIQAKQ